MKIARFTTGDSPRFGIVEEEAGRIIVLKGDPMFSPVEATGEIVKLDEVRLLSPVIPRSKVVCIGKNYLDHVQEMGGENPAAPVVFLKPNTSVIGPDDPIVLPQWSQEVHHEVELGVVIKTLTKNITPQQVPECVLGYLVGNDCTARDIQRQEKQWTRAKGWDTSCPLGPWIVVDPELDAQNLPIRCSVNGEIRQEGNTSQMMRTAAQLVAYVSTIFTLLPGDVVLTGTPSGVGPLQPGDRVQVEIEGIGSFSNPVVRR